MGSTFRGTWEDPGGGFIKFTVKRALKQDQTLHMEGKLQYILYFSTECGKTITARLTRVENALLYDLK